MLPCQTPGITDSATRLLDPLSVYCELVRQQELNATSVLVCHHVQLSAQIRTGRGREGRRWGTVITILRHTQKLPLHFFIFSPFHSSFSLSLFHPFFLLSVFPSLPSFFFFLFVHSACLSVWLSFSFFFTFFPQFFLLTSFAFHMLDIRVAHSFSCQHLKPRLLASSATGHCHVHGEPLFVSSKSVLFILVHSSRNS